MWDSSHTLTHHTINQIGTSQGTFLLFLIASLNFLFSVTVDRSFRPVEPRFPHKAKALKQKPTKLGNVLTILNLRSGNMGTGESFFSSSRPLSIPSFRWLWVEVSNLLCFYAFFVLLLLAFWFSLVKASLAFCSLYIWNFGLDSPQ